MPAKRNLDHSHGNDASASKRQPLTHRDVGGLQVESSTLRPSAEVNRDEDSDTIPDPDTTAEYELPSLARWTRTAQFHQAIHYYFDCKFCGDNVPIKQAADHFLENHRLTYNGKQITLPLLEAMAERYRKDSRFVLLSKNRQELIVSWSNERWMSIPDGLSEVPRELPKRKEGYLCIYCFKAFSLPKMSSSTRAQEAPFETAEVQKDASLWHAKHHCRQHYRAAFQIECEEHNILMTNVNAITRHLHKSHNLATPWSCTICKPITPDDSLMVMDDLNSPHVRYFTSELRLAQHIARHHADAWACPYKVEISLGRRKDCTEQLSLCRSILQNTKPNQWNIVVHHLKQIHKLPADEVKVLFPKSAIHLVKDEPKYDDAREHNQTTQELFDLLEPHPEHSPAPAETSHSLPCHHPRHHNHRSDNLVILAYKNPECVRSWYTT